MHIGRGLSRYPTMADKNQFRKFKQVLLDVVDKQGVMFPKLAQAQPGQVIKFEKIDIEESISLLRSSNQILHNLNSNYNTKQRVWRMTILA